MAQNTERWIMVAGTAGAFHTDARVFNPSFEKDIVVTAMFLPAGPPLRDNRDRLAGTPASFTVSKRSQHVLNDVTTALFGSTPTVLGALLFRSADPFEVTSRIYSLDGVKTVGQFGPGLPATGAKTKGAVLQIRANGVKGEAGTFRTNIGVVNTTDQEAVVNWRLYDKSNALAGTGTTTMPPYGVTQPLVVRDATYFQGLPGTLDLSEAWVSFTSTQPLFVYASVLDNGTEDQTFIPAVDDVGVAPEPEPEPEPTTHTFDVTLEDFSIQFSPNPTNAGIKLGDVVVLRIRRIEGLHGFQLNGPSGVVVPSMSLSNNVMERTFTVTAAGRYDYFCTVLSCGVGHDSMVGAFTIQGSSDPGGGPGCTGPYCY